MTMLCTSRGDDSLILELSGQLDSEVGEQLVEVTKVALTVSPDVVISVAAVTEWTVEGLSALSECALLGASIPVQIDPGHSSL